MTTVIHACPVLADPIRTSLQRLGRDDIHVALLESGPDARACRPRCDALEGNTNIVFVGECGSAPPGDSVARVQWRRATTCFHWLASDDFLDQELASGAHLLVASMVRTSMPIWRTWGFSEVGDARELMSGAVSRFVVLATSADDETVAKARAQAEELGVQLNVSALDATRLDQAVAEAIDALE